MGEFLGGSSEWVGNTIRRKAASDTGTPSHSGDEPGINGGLTRREFPTAPWFGRRGDSAMNRESMAG